MKRETFINCSSLHTSARAALEEFYHNYAGKLPMFNGKTRSKPLPENGEKLYRVWETKEFIFVRKVETNQ